MGKRQERSEELSTRTPQRVINGNGDSRHDEELRQAQRSGAGTLLTISQRVDCCRRQEEAFNETSGCISSEGVESDEFSLKSE